MRADAQRNRERILLAARQVFVDQGPDVALEKIARRAGVGIATLYRRFPSRADLIRGVIAETLTGLYDHVRRAIEQEPDEFEALRRAMHTALELELGVLFSTLSGRFAVDDLIEESQRDAAALLQGLVFRAQAAQLLRDDVGFGDIVLAIIRLGRPLPGRLLPLDRDLAHRQLELYLDGLRPAAALSRTAPLPGPMISLGWFRRFRRQFGPAWGPASENSEKG